MIDALIADAAEALKLGSQALVDHSATILSLESALRDKDDIIQSQYAEITELRRQLALATEGVKHWRREAERLSVDEGAFW